LSHVLYVKVPNNTVSCIGCKRFHPILSQYTDVKSSDKTGTVSCTFGCKKF
jgi:hypothetical protein